MCSTSAYVKYFVIEDGMDISEIPKIVLGSKVYPTVGLVQLLAADEADDDPNE